MTDFAPVFSRKPVPVTICGETFHIPWQPAAEWANRLNRVSSLAMLFATQEDRDRMGLLLVIEPDAWEQLQRESYRLFQEQTDRKWWEAGRLLAASTTQEVLGHLTLANVDPWNVSVGQWCAAVYALCTKDQDQQGRLKFDFSLSIPPEGFEDEWDDGSDDGEEIAMAVAKMMG